MSEHTGYFVGLHKPADVRRDLLEGAKLSVTILKSQYRVRELRARKVELLGTLASMAGELSSLVSSLQEEMPEEKPDKIPKVVRELQQRQAKEAAKAAAAEKAAKAAAKRSAKKAAKPAPKPVPKPAPKPAPRPVDDMAHLEEKLADIEKKLNKL